MSMSRNAGFERTSPKRLDAASTDADGDGAVEVSELIAQVSLRVARASNGKQNPFVARRELFGDFAVAAAAK